MNKKVELIPTLGEVFKLSHYKIILRSFGFTEIHWQFLAFRQRSNWAISHLIPKKESSKKDCGIKEVRKTLKTIAIGKKY